MVVRAAPTPPRRGGSNATSTSASARWSAPSPRRRRGSRPTPRAAAGLNAASRRRARALRCRRRKRAAPVRDPQRSPSRSMTRRSSPARGRARRQISPNERISGPSTLFVTPSPLGLRLVHVQPITSSEGSRLGAVATEHVLSPAPAATTLTPTDYTLQTGLGPASLRTEGAGDLSRPGAVLLSTPSGEPLAEAWVDPPDPAHGAGRLAAPGGSADARAARVHGAGCSSGRCSTAGYAATNGLTCGPRSRRWH